MNEYTANPESVVDHLEAQGFIPGAPAHVTRWAQQCDRQAASDSPCPCCGRSWLTYLAFHQGDDYRAVARCESCLHELEF